MPEADAFTIDTFDTYIRHQLDLLLQDAMASTTGIAKKKP
jgi:hypothetical protein